MKPEYVIPNRPPHVVIAVLHGCISPLRTGCTHDGAGLVHGRNDP